jgi:hypothetical protein
MNFDWRFYISNYLDLRKANINTEKLARMHWEKFGQKEGRIGTKQITINNESKYECKCECEFDWKFYVSIYPDVKNKNKDEAINHWKIEGKKNNRICCLKKMHSVVSKNENIIKIEHDNYRIKLIDEKLINILIRTSNRPESFIKCIKSILEQKYNNYKVIICYDKEESINYLENYKDNNKIEYFPININNPNKYKFNLYCNYLMDKVNDGYIMFLDDDDILSHDLVLNIINDNLKSEHDLLIWRFMRPDKLIYPKNINNIILGNIDTTSFCFHNKFKYLNRWNDKQCGDYHFITGLIKKKKFNINIFSYILTKTSYNNKIANFGN